MRHLFFHSDDVRTLKRTRINKLIQNSTKKKPLTLISTPIGFGKTLAVKNFFNDISKNEYLYLSSYGKSELDLWDIISKTMSKINFLPYKNLKKIASLENFKVIETELNSLLDSSLKSSNDSGGKFTFILDDFDIRKFENIFKLIKSIVLKEVNRVNFIIITRQVATYDCLELEIKNICSILDQTILGFTSSEIQDYAALNNEVLTSSQADYIYDMTKGWLFLIRLMLDDYKTTRHLEKTPRAALHAKEILFNRQTDENKDVILKLLLIENFTFEQAVYLIGNRYSATIMESIINEQTLLSIDKQTRKYTVYPLLRQGLVEELKIKGTDKKSIFISCGEWFESLSQFKDAIIYYVKAEEYSRVAVLLDCLENCDPKDNDLVKMESIFSSLPKKIKFKNSELYISFLLSYILSVSFTKGKKLYQEAKKYYLIESETKASRKLLGELSFIDCVLQFNNAENLLFSLKRSYNYLEGKASSQKLIYSEFFFGLTSVLFVFYRLRETLKQTTELIKECSSYFITLTDGCGGGVEFLIESEYYLFTGEYEKSTIFARKAAYKSSLQNQKDIQLCSLSVLLRISMVYGNKKECDKIIDDIKKIGKTNEIILKTAQMVLAYFYGCTGDAKSMPDWILDGNLKDEYKLPFKANSLKYIPIALAMILKGEYIKLEVISSVMKAEYLKEEVFALGVIYSYVFDCIAKWNLNQRDQALDSLAIAVSLSKADEIVHLFIELSLYILEPLEIISKTDRYAKRLLGNCKASKQIFEGKKLQESNNAFILTAREIEVMKLVMDGYKQAQIAQMLYVSVPTIKKHIQKIYRKFGVNSKAEAIKFVKNNPSIGRIIPMG